MTPRAPGASRPARLRGRVALVAAVAALAAGLVMPTEIGGGAGGRPNVIVILTDDQRADTIPTVTPVMPYLQSRALDPLDHWIVIANAFVNTPLCCPSRASLLTGEYAHHTGVLTNADAARFDERSTLATWLDAAGYHTGLVGKYLNGYPAARPPYVPPGWDRWWARRHGPVTTLYRDYTLIEDGVPVHHGSDDQDYLTDVLADEAIGFIRSSPPGRPFFLWFAPTAPHPPWVAPQRYQGTFADATVPTAPSVGELDVSDKPGWVRALPAFGTVRLERLRDAQRRSFATLRAVDDAVRRLVTELRIRGELDRTVIVVTSDNGFSFGEHRWVKKSCPYAPCLRVPFLVRIPGVPHRIDDAIVSSVDLAATIAEIAGISPDVTFDGVSLLPLLRSRSRADLPGQVYAEFAGDDTIPAWWEVRTSWFAYVELATGERELYALADDPHELVNVVDDPRFGTVVERLAASLGTHRSS